MNFDDISVLVCDDSILARKQFIRILNEIGINNVLEAVDGQLAVELYKNNKPNLVFMDIIMPKKSGIEALKEIIDFDPEAKVIMASSALTQKYLKDAITAGACDFIQKPISEEHVKRIVFKLAKVGE